MTDTCNLACKYCFAEYPRKQGVMTVDTLRTVIEQCLGFEATDLVRFVWHGGEPLAPGIKFFDQVVALQREFIGKKRFTNLVQTNATLLTPTCVQFFADHGFSLGFSLDGPGPFHDATRTCKDGSGSFGDVWKNICHIARKRQEWERTESGDCPRALRPSAVLVLNRGNVDSIDALYSFFHSHEIPFAVNALVIAGRAKEHGDLAITPDEFGRAMIRLFDLWFHETGKPIEIRDLSRALNGVLKRPRAQANSEGACLTAR